ncbi:MAG: HDIG domain-containing protein [Chitinispirillales bacterium]|jgi:putative nucleotidyltransferase with HDIG domain|nr:HDIG domain-containing protein [Chitinispirillales bacterium]
MSNGSKSETRGIRAVRKRVGLRVRQWLRNFAPPMLLAAFSGCLLLLFPYDDIARKFDLPKAGAASKETVIAPFTFDIIRTQEELERERKRAMDQVLLVMDYDTAASAEAFRKIAEVSDAIKSVSAGAKAHDSLREASHSRLSRDLSGKAVETLLRRPTLVDEAYRLLSELTERGVSATLLYAPNEELNERRIRFNATFESNQPYAKKYVTVRRDGRDGMVAVSDIPVKEAALEMATSKLKREQGMDDGGLNTVYELLHACARPNVRVNNRETSDKRREAADEVLEVSGKVIKDTEIVRKHQEVTPEVVQRLRSLHVAMERIEHSAEKRRADAAYAGQVMLLLILLCFLAFYMKKYKPSLVANPKGLLALCIIALLQILAIRLGTEYFPKLFEGWEKSTAIPEYLIPVTMGALLCTILFGMQVSMLVSLFIGIYFAVVTGFNHYFFLYAFLNSVVAAFLNYRIRYRWHFFKAIPPMALVAVIIIAAWQMMGWRFDTFLVNIACALAGILVSVFTAMMLTPFFERVFDITTDMTLIELSDMNHPILKKLSIEAAGTYNHSVLVGNLAESAAQAVGANALLARVASYYHDIGKIDKPDYFVENCLGDKNRHNKLSPTMSALIICSHVKEGVDLAKRYKLPKVIQDIILQHHGDSSVSFFYEKALEQDPHKQVQEKDFHYPGPTPQTREAAIIMLADSVEAASRSLATSSPKLLRELVKKIIRDKFLSSQLDQCNLTLRDLNDITDGFMPVLQGIFHSRIEYPNK